MKNGSKNNVIWKFLIFLRPYWRKGVVAFLFMLLSVGLQMPMPFLTRYLLDTVIVSKSFNTLNLIGFVLVGVLLANEASNFFQVYLLSVFRNRVLFDIRVKLFDHVQRANLSLFYKRQTGYLMSRLSDDVEAVYGLLAQTLVSAGQNLLVFIAGIICTLSIHTRLALVCFAILPIYLAAIVLFNNRIRRLSSENREKIALLNGELQELLSGISVIKAFTAEGRSRLSLVATLKTTVRSMVRLDVLSSLASVSATLISAVGPLLLIWYGCGEIMHGRLTIGSLLAFNSFIGFLFGPVRSLYDLNLGAQRSLAAVERIFEMLGIEQESDGACPIIIRQGRVTFDKVSFAYRDDRPVLKDISFEIEPGTTIAFVGRSGSGKTTISSLLMKYYRHDQGIITIDGQDINGIRNASLRRQIGLVSQDPFLFSNTIRENIRFGLPEASDQDVEAAALMAHAHEFISVLPDGYDTVVGERGATLSGGQRQRLAIARAIIKNPRILILDEATSQVDNESERLIQSAVEQLMRGRTTIIISHRLHTVRDTDAILVLKNGTIIARGTHRALMDTSDYYRELTREVPEPAADSHLT